MGKNKFRRSVERKEARDAEKFKHNQKRVNDKPKKKQKWRTLHKDGRFDGIAFGSDYKIGNGGIIGLSFVGAIALFFVVGLTLYPIQQEDTGGMEMCANAFCEWFAILTGADEYGAKQTREQVPMEDRDFLPPSGGSGEPSGFLFPLVKWADARGDDEPTCYSPACKAKHAEASEHFDTEEQQAKSINEKILEKKLQIKKTEDVIKIIEEKIREYKLEIPKDELELRLMESDLDDELEITKEMRYEYDRMRYEYSDKEEYLEYEEEYKQQKKKLSDLQFKYDKLENDIDRDNELLEKEEEYLVLAEVDLLMFIDELNEMKISLHKIHRAGNLFAIRLSETCNNMIKHGINTKEIAKMDENNWVYSKETVNVCPTYRELKDTFDNTLEPISGEFVDMGYDVRRADSGYSDYWRYYYNMPFWQVITVDPDNDMLERAMVITVAASEFRYVTEHSNELVLTKFENGTMTERAYTYYENIAIDQECRHATVAPDIELVGQVLKYFMEHCEGDRDFVMKNRIIMPYLSFDKFESQWYQYLLWLNDMIKQYGPK